MGVCEKIPNTIGTMFNTPALYRPRRHAHPQAPEDHADGRRAARPHGRLRRHVRRVPERVRADVGADLRRELQSAGGVRADRRRHAHPRHELAQPFPDQRRSAAQPRRDRLAGLRADEQGVRDLGLRHGRRAHDRDAGSRARGREVPAQSGLLRRLADRRSAVAHHRRPDGRGGRHPLRRMQSRPRHPDEAASRFRRPLQPAGHFPAAHQSRRAAALSRAQRSGGAWRAGRRELPSPPPRRIAGPGTDTRHQRIESMDVFEAVDFAHRLPRLPRQAGRSQHRQGPDRARRSARRRAATCNPGTSTR